MVVVHLCKCRNKDVINVYHRISNLKLAFVSDRLSSFLVLLKE